MGDQPSGTPRFRLVPGRGLGERPSPAPPPAANSPAPVQVQEQLRQMPMHAMQQGPGPNQQHQQIQQHHQQQPQQLQSQHQQMQPQYHQQQNQIHQQPPQHHQPQHQQQQPQHLQQQQNQMMGPGHIQNQQLNQMPVQHMQPQPQHIPHPVVAQPQPGPSGGNGNSEDEKVQKCVRFFKTLISLSTNQQGGNNPQQHNRETVALVKDLVASVLFTNMPAEDFTRRLQEALKSQAQPHLLPFLQKTLPVLRAAIRNGDVVIEGISPPPGVQLGNQMPNEQVQLPRQSPLQQHLSHPSQMQQGSPMHFTQGQNPNQMPQQNQQMPQQNQQLVQQNQQMAPQNQQMVQQNQHMPPPQMGMPRPVKSEPQFVKQEPQFIKQEPHFVKQEQMEVDEPAHQEEEPAESRQLQEGRMKNALLRPEDILQRIMQNLTDKCSVDEDVLSLISDATEYRLKELLSELSVLAEHRVDPLRLNPNYAPVDDTKRQLKFLEDLDRQQEEQRENREKEALIRMSKNKGVGKDQLEKAKEMQRADAEAKRNRDANAAALAALGGADKPAKPKWDQVGGSGAGATVRPRTIRVNIRDLHALASHDPMLARSQMIHKLALGGGMQTESM